MMTSTKTPSSESRLSYPLTGEESWLNFWLAATCRWRITNYAFREGVLRTH
jgi:hypothetical protein